jgi:hypothetical protein
VLALFSSAYVVNTYNADQHEPVIPAKGLPPNSHSKAHGKYDPTQDKQDDCAIEQRHSIAGYLDSSHIPGPRFQTGWKVKGLQTDKHRERDNSEAL